MLSTALVQAESANSLATGARSQISLAGTWKFYPPLEDLENNHPFLHPDFNLATTPREQFKEYHFGWTFPGFDDEGWMELKVPSSWNQSIPDLWSYEGHGWYRREVMIPQEWKEKRVVFHSDGANYRTVIFVNGHEVGCHEGGYLPFSFPIHDRITFGEKNTIAALVDNKALSDRCPMEQHDWWNHGGLYRSVWLEATDRVYVDHAVVTTDPSKEPAVVSVRADVTTEIPAGVECRIDAKLSDSSAKTVAEESMALTFSGGRAVAELRLSVSDALLWSPESPNLYSLDLAIRDSASQTLRDSWSTRVGIRSIEVEGMQLLLNGKPLLIKGMNRYENYPETGNTPSETSLKRDLQMIKEMGANALRCHYPNSPGTYDLFDEVGIIAVCEVPLYHWGRPIHTTKALEAAKQQLAEMIHCYGNHPSIAFWSVSNENRTIPRGGHKGEDERSDMVAAGNLELVDLAHELDPTRLVIEPSNCWPEDPVLKKTDLLSVNVYFGSLTPHVDALHHLSGTMHDRMEQLRSEVPGKPILVSEFGGWCVRGLKTDYYPGEGYQAGLLKNYWEAFLREPGFVGGFVWCFADSDVHRKYSSIMETRCAYGVFDIHRQPKEAVETLRTLWLEE